MALKQRNITIHIGMPKSASTTLQKNVFSQFKEANYCGPEKNYLGTDAFNKLVRTTDEYFNFDQCESEFNSALNIEKPIVLSSEFACAPIAPLSSGIPQDRLTIAKRLKKLAPDAKILIIIRNQLTLHQSLYVQTLRNESSFLSSRKISFRKWIDRNIQLHEKGWQTAFEFCDYDALIKTYESLFDHVHVVPFEEVVKDFGAFVRSDLRDILDFPFDEDVILKYEASNENNRHNYGEIYTEQMLTKSILFAKKRMRSIVDMVPKKTRERTFQKLVSSANKLNLGKIKTNYRQDQLAWVENFYKEGNKAVSGTRNLKLEELGYPV